MLPSSLLPSSRSRARSRTHRRLQTDVLGGAEHAPLDVTSSYGAVKEVKRLSALQRAQYKSQDFSWSVSTLPLVKHLFQQDAVGSISVYGHDICPFWVMLYFLQRRWVVNTHLK